MSECHFSRERHTVLDLFPVNRTAIDDRDTDFDAAVKDSPDLVFVRPSWVDACVAKKVRLRI